MSLIRVFARKDDREIDKLFRTAKSLHDKLRFCPAGQSHKGKTVDLFRHTNSTVSDIVKQYSADKYLPINYPVLYQERCEYVHVRSIAVSQRRRPFHNTG
jgi:predicted metalloendopeptidase